MNIVLSYRKLQTCHKSNQWVHFIINKAHQFGEKIEKKLQVANYKSIIDQQVENFKCQMWVTNLHTRSPLSLIIWMNPTGRKAPLIGLIFQVQKETIAYVAPPTPNNGLVACHWCQENWFNSYNREPLLYCNFGEF